MLSVIGDDHMGAGGEGSSCRAWGRCIGYRDEKNQTSAIYLSILNDKSDMELAISDMDVVNTFFGVSGKEYEFALIILKL